MSWHRAEVKPIQRHRVRVHDLIFEFMTTRDDPAAVDEMVRRYMRRLPEWSASSVTVEYSAKPDYDRPRGIPRQRGSLA